MQRVTIKAYAIKHKLSIFNVMKMVKSGTLMSETVDVDGKETLFIILDNDIEEVVKKGIISAQKNPSTTLEDDVKKLQNEVILLRDEIEVLKNRL